VDALQGIPDPLAAYRRGRLASPIRRNERRTEFVRAVSHPEGDEILLEPLPGQESHMIVRTARADVLVLVEAGEGELGAGDEVRYLGLF
jgi:molybdopterin biosynthesis enzyme